MNRQNKNKENRKIGLVLAVLALLMMTGTANAEMYKVYIDSHYGFYGVVPEPKGYLYMDKNITIYIGDVLELYVASNEKLTIKEINDFTDVSSGIGAIYGSIYNFPGIHEFYIKEYPKLQHLIVNVKEKNPIIIPTPTLTNAIQHDWIDKDIENHPKVTPTVTVTPGTAISTPITSVDCNNDECTEDVSPGYTETVSPGHPDEYWERMREQYPPSKRATLEVTNKIDRSNNEAVITINMKNIGNDIAKFVNFSSSIPSELGSTLISGAEWDGNKLIWKGDINAGEEHSIIYKVKPVKIDIEIPIKITYVKDSITTNKIISKATTEGIKSESILDSIDPQDLQTILLVIQISKAVLPGFEAIFGLSGILAIYMVMRKRKD